MQELLNAIEINRKFLKRRFECRICFYVIPIIGLVICWYIDFSDYISNIISGLLVSFIAWSVIESYTLYLSTEAQYKNEKELFLTGWQKYDDKIREIIKELNGEEKTSHIEQILTEVPANEKSKKFWSELCNWSNQVNGYLGMSILRYPCYTLDKDFSYVLCYNWRLFWLISAHLYNHKCDSKGLYEKLIEINSIRKPADIIESLNKMQDSIRSFCMAYERMKKLSLNGEVYNPPREIYTNEMRDIVVMEYSINEFGNGKSEYRYRALIYKPYRIIMNHLQNNYSDNIFNNFLLVFKLMTQTSHT